MKESEISSQSSPLLSDCKAKTIVNSAGTMEMGLDVESHCKIVGRVASELMARFPESIRELLFPPGSAYLASIHDVGKINPMFLEKLHRSLPLYTPNSLECLRSARPELEEMTGWHAGVGQSTLCGISPPYIDKIVGSHHGYSPTNAKDADSEALGGKAWQKIRVSLLLLLKEYFNEELPLISDDSFAAVLAGLTTVSDWIGSGSLFENLRSLENVDLQSMVKQAVDQAGFVRPQVCKGLSFQDIFTFEPYPIQEKFYTQISDPGVYVLEATMGEGKTEAALYAAYSLISQGKATGIYFALPTRITSERMHERIAKFLDSILEEDSKYKPLLLYANSWLFETDMGVDSKVGNSWFNSRKRGILAPFAVGTIDQALLAVLNVRHNFVRTFGLAGKVVILDEVHSYDVYTGTVMDFLIQMLRDLGSTVILLSATLTGKRKNMMIGVLDAVHARVQEDYPLVTVSTTKIPLETYTTPSSTQRIVHVDRCSNDAEVACIVREKALCGEQILWIENTVSDAQKSFQTFAAWGKQNEIEVGLLHSRFPAYVRATLEANWVSLYGKEGEERRKICGRILIGTQVLEQSLDIDADYLVTRLAPTDMILQRIGRLWRHPFKDLRPVQATPSVMILVPQSLQPDFGLTGMVYAPYVLQRSREVWSSLEDLCLPSMMRSLIEDTYKDRKEEGVLQTLKHEVEKQREVLQRLAHLGIAKVGKGFSDDANTRCSDLPSCDVLLLMVAPLGICPTLSLMDGTQLELKQTPSPQQKKEIARCLMSHLISVPAYLAPGVLSVAELRWLSPFLYVSEYEEERVRVGILTMSGTIDGMGGREASLKYTLGYHPLLGYVSEKKKG
ncbi:MAG: CRISPR-associated helicase Cas3' [Sphaerochaeta sp.]|nr:CRISPR-associated helicase Cas3' [Sphaerochaeta sp.]